MSNVTCIKTGKKVKRELAEDSDDWVLTDEGWLSPHANPESDVSWD